MEIESLRLSISEQELDTLAARLLANQKKVRALRVKLISGGIRVAGEYQLFVGVPFETLWRVSVLDGKLAAHFEQLKVAGLRGGMLKGALMEAIAAASQKEDSLKVEADTVLFNHERLLQKHGLPLSIRFSAVFCESGRLIIESSQAGSASASTKKPAEESSPA